MAVLSFERFMHSQWLIVNGEFISPSLHFPAAAGAAGVARPVPSSQVWFPCNTSIKYPKSILRSPNPADRWTQDSLAGTRPCLMEAAIRLPEAASACLIG